MRSRSRGIALGVLTAGALAWPASAQALTVSVTGDDGVPQALTGQTMRNMAPQIAIGRVAGEGSYSAAVVGPKGQSAMVTGCSDSTEPRTVLYEGNGLYTFTVTVYAGASCTGAQSPGTLTFNIQAGVSLAPDPNTPLLTREPDEFANVEHRLPIAGNLGADTYDVRYSTSSRLTPDGGLAGEPKSAFVDAATSTVPIRFSKPGRYTVVARARVFGGAATPWTAPLTLRVYAPFDFSSSSFPDARGPSYRLSVRLRERTARGRVRISVARRWTGPARYRSIGTVRIRGGGFTKRFTLSQTGEWRIRYRFEGSATTAPGTVVEKVRIRRTARSSAARAAPRTVTAAR